MKKVYKDFFLHTEIAILMVITISLIGASLWRGLTFWHFLFFAAGLVVFMFSEYLTHRFVFHLKAPKHPFLLKLLKRLHYDHHVYPNDLHLLFLPIWYSLPSMVALSAIFYGLHNEWFHTFSFSAGLLSMLLIYEWTHYVAHTPLKPKTKFGKWLKKVHILHHYKNENYWFGVSTPFVDVLFGTLKDEKDVEMSGTARDLEKKTVS
ncbi:sterol desaturase family protein [Falsibacillus pallidus]|uniref:Sterol desaturase/sphingolipid hydroxylase (Fatty acid hydroxylase superfamily) n=1 Tax=Falsibacillus pallidus TaxID=493781 RepID=A0A370GHF8_9BACI|nr:sterol desaturase family protein [Falsibacillus pallidus]RDI43235.1 sterol desaturase/sphingolipid hydroxylase (fatty acid hydroxylase superfamily) [Falsibacillus pallidus]